MTNSAQTKKSYLISYSLVWWIFMMYITSLDYKIIFSLLSLTFAHLGDRHRLLIGFEKRPIAQTRNSSQCPPRLRGLVKTLTWTNTNTTQ